MDTQRLGTLLSGCRDLQLVMVSACHSQTIGEVFLEAGVPAVVAINSSFKVYDDAARAFAATLYAGLAQNLRAREAFEKAQNFVAAHKHRLEVFSCCCAHPHTDDCKWLQECREKGSLYAHELHVPKCKCKFPGNLHTFSPRATCQFASDFVENYANWDPYDIYPEDVQNAMYMCCCQPTLPHDESMKFLYLKKKRNEVQEPVVPFPHCRSGELKVKELGPAEHRPQNVGAVYSIGRRKLIRSIVKELAYAPENSRLLHVSGEEGMGKK